MTTTPLFDIEYMEENQETAHTTLNDALNILEAMARLSVEDRDLTAPPGGESNGEVWIVGSGATGAWAGEDGHLALYYDGWVFVDPQEGTKAYVKDEDAEVVYNGSGWVVFHRLSKQVSATFFSPAAGDEALLMYTTVAITMTKLRGVIDAGTNVVVDLRHHSDRSNAGNQVESSNFTITSTSTGTVFSSGFEDATIPAGSFFWAEIDSVNGAVTRLELAIDFTED